MHSYPIIPFFYFLTLGAGLCVRMWCDARSKYLQILGVPQGSVLIGAILYCLHSKPVSDIIRFGLLDHSYAEDTQIYITIKKQDWFADKLSDVENCVSEIKHAETE